MAGGAEHPWRQWAVQILVLLSMFLQVFLFFAADLRRHKTSTVLSILLWLAYLAADSTATYTIGHLSLSSTTREHQLVVALWAPFLLLHLGGQDTITAYALEDNRLWLRHLQSLVVQTAGVAYVVYRYIFWKASGILISALVLMFIVGVVKYGERIWALKCANNEDLENYLTELEKRQQGEKLWYRGSGIGLSNGIFRDTNQDYDEDKIPYLAHILLGMCLGLFLDRRADTSNSLLKQAANHYLESSTMIWKLIGMELSLIYDILYTKTRVIHTWIGLCIRAGVLAAIVSSFFLFLVAGKDGYSTVDVVITYILLVVAILLEIKSAFSEIFSSWTSQYLYRRQSRFRLVVNSLPRFAKMNKGRRRMSYTIGQFNVLEYCSKHSFVSGNLSSTRVCLRPSVDILADLGRLVEEEIVRVGRELDGIEDRMNSLDKNPELPALDLGTDFSSRIIIWHTATDAILCSPGMSDAHTEHVKTLSDYMMFLLVERPEMLPGLSRRIDCTEALAWVSSIKVITLGPSATSRERLGQSLLKVGTQEYYQARRAGTSPCKRGAKLAFELMAKKWEPNTLLQHIFGAWVEMMCYAGSHCSRDSHARRLSSGGEFLTMVWLLTRHVAVVTHPDPRYDSSPEA